MENYQPVLPPGAVKKSIEPSMQDSTPMQSAANAAGVLPAGIHIEQAGPCSVLKAKSLAIVRVNRHLVARKKTGSDPSPRRTERQSCREPTAIGNASRSYDWNWPYGIDHGRNEGHRRDFSTDMATGLPSLCDNDVNTTVYCLTRFNSRADSMKHYGTTRFRTGYEGRRLAPEKRDNRHALLQTDLKALFLRKFQIQVDGERFCGESASFADLLTQCLYVRSPQRKRTQPAGVADCGSKSGADRSTHGRLNYRNFDPKFFTTCRNHWGTPFE